MSTTNDIVGNNKESTEGGEICKRCSYVGCDIRLIGCGCTIHARCAPLTLLLGEGTGWDECDSVPQAVKSEQPRSCPICCIGQFKGIYLHPMSFKDLEKAGDLRRHSAMAAVGRGDRGEGAEQQNQDGKLSGHVRKRETSLEEDELHHQIHAESSFLLLSHTEGGATIDRHNQRTGRWTSEEMAFVDYLVHAFDIGSLPIPHGVKLNEFLGDMLLCKSSRLTKKMKNAKLSTRSYTLRSKPSPDGGTFCCQTISRLQDLFLTSVPSEPTKLELRFNVTKQWRMHFFNLCVQVGYEALDGRDWLASLEEMERRASHVEERMRQARRQRMSRALMTDGSQEAHPLVFIGGMSAPQRKLSIAQSEPTEAQPQPVPSSSVSVDPSLTTPSVSANPAPSPSAMASIPEDISSPSHKLSTDAPKPLPSSGGSGPGNIAGITATDDQEGDDEAFLTKLLEISNAMGTSGTHTTRPRLFSDDFSVNMDIAFDPIQQSVTQTVPKFNAFESPACLGDCGAYLEAVVSYMESENVPFEHVDIWVPSFLPSGPDGSKGESTGSSSQASSVAASGNSSTTKNGLRLCHAGHATRADLPSSFIAYQLNEFGIYSTNFSFAPGVGLPGRVYISGKPTWENSIQHANPTHFERCGGAKVYGVKTVLGIPVNNPEIGRMVVAMYSTSDVAKDVELVKKCLIEFYNWIPEPRWKLVIDLGISDADEAKNDASATKIYVERKTQGTVGSGNLICSNSTSEGNMIVHSHGPLLCSGNKDISLSNSNGASSQLGPGQQCSNARTNVNFLQSSQNRESPVSTAMTTTADDTLICHRHTNPQDDAGNYQIRSMSSGSVCSRASSCAATVKNSGGAIGSAAEPCQTSKKQSADADDIDEEEVRLAALLGDHMPLSDNFDQLIVSSQSTSSSTGVPISSPGLLGHFISLRLLLLRSPARRSPFEQDMLDILKKSFRGYVKDNHRSGKELANLIAKDWMYLTSSFALAKQPSQTGGTFCQQGQPPSMSTTNARSASGTAQTGAHQAFGQSSSAPHTYPGGRSSSGMSSTCSPQQSSLSINTHVNSLLQSPSSTSFASCDGMVFQRGRTISASDSNPPSPNPSGNVRVLNIVPES